MNKRNIKKFNNKNNHRTFYEMRKSRIVNNAKSKLSENSGATMLHIIDSKRFNLKHPLKISLLTNIFPVSCKLTGGTI